MTNPNPQQVTSFPTVISTTCTLLQGDGTGFTILAKCTGTPPTTAGIFQIGCLMIKADSVAGTGQLVNTGTTDTPVWNVLGQATGTAANFVSDNANGANNAICVSLFTSGTTKAVVTTGTRIAIKLGRSLQKGANTLNLNGTTKNIVSHFNPATSGGLTTAYGIGGILEVIYTPGVTTSGVFQDVSQ